MMSNSKDEGSLVIAVSTIRQALVSAQLNPITQSGIIAYLRENAEKSDKGSKLTNIWAACGPPPDSSLESRISSSMHRFRILYDNAEVPQELLGRKITHLVLLARNLESLYGMCEALASTDSAIQYLELAVCGDRRPRRELQKLVGDYTIFSLDSNFSRAIERLPEICFLSSASRGARGLNYQVDASMDRTFGVPTRQENEEVMAAQPQRQDAVANRAPEQPTRNRIAEGFQRGFNRNDARQPASDVHQRGYNVDDVEEARPLNKDGFNRGAVPQVFRPPVQFLHASALEKDQQSSRQNVQQGLIDNQDDIIKISRQELADMKAALAGCSEIKKIGLDHKEKKLRSKQKHNKQKNGAAYPGQTKPAGLTTPKIITSWSQISPIAVKSPSPHLKRLESQASDVLCDKPVNSTVNLSFENDILNEVYDEVTIHEDGSQADQHCEDLNGPGKYTNLRHHDVIYWNGWIIRTEPVLEDEGHDTEAMITTYWKLCPKGAHNCKLPQS